MSKLYFPIRRIIYITLGWASLLLPKKRLDVVILCYHSINSDGWLYGVSPEVFKKQMEILLKKYTFITLSDISEFIHKGKAFRKPAVAITFDDGYKDILQVKSFIAEKKIKPTLFVLADRKRANRAELETDREFLTTSEIKSLVQDGWELGCHTATHPDMNSLTEIELNREIVEAKSELEKEFDTLLKYIAYPKGQYNQKVIKISKEARFELGLTVDEGDISPRTQPLLVPRICIDRTRTLLEYSLITNILIVYLRKFMTDLRRLKD